MTRRHRGFQIPVRRGDDAHIDVQRRRPADALELFFFERAQNLGLHRERQIADFVEEQRAPVRELELAGLSLRRAGERAFLVAEQLRFEQRLGNRRAVDGDERTVRPRAERVERPREQLLAGAALSFEQHGGVGGSRAVQRHGHLLQLRIVADNQRRTAALGQLVFQDHVFGRQPALCERALDQQQQMIRTDRLRQEVERPFFHRGDGVLNAAERRHHDDRQLRVELFRCAQHPEAVTFRQAKIRQDDGGVAREQRRLRLRLIARLDDGVPLRFERKAEHRPQRVFVLDNQNRRVDRLAGSRAHRIQPGGTPARRASSWKSARAFLSS